MHSIIHQQSVASLLQFIRKQVTSI